MTSGIVYYMIDMIELQNSYIAAVFILEYCLQQLSTYLGM